MWRLFHGLHCRMAGLFVAAMVPLAHGADSMSLTLEDAIEKALVHNRDLVRGALELQGRQLDEKRAVENARGLAWVPEGTMGSGPEGEDWRAGMRAEATGRLGTKIEVGAAARQLESVDLRRGEVRAEVTQPLFRNFGSLVHNEPIVVAGEALQAARRAWERDRSALALQVAETYEELIYLGLQIQSDEALAARLEKTWELANAREQQGRAARTDVMRLDFQRGEAAARLEVVRSRIEIQYQKFADLLGLPLDHAFQLVPPPLLDLELPEDEHALAVAMAERPDYAQALQDVETASRRLLLARRNLLPDLRLTARQTVYGEGADWSDAGRLDQSDWFVGLIADANLNMRGARMDSQRAEIDVEGERQIAEIVRHRLALEVNAAMADYRRSRSEMALEERNRTLAANRMELARALFDAGRAHASSVSDAEADLVGAELAERASRREASVAAYRLLHVLGTLVPASRDLVMHNKEAE